MTTVTGLLAYDPSKVKPGWIAFFIVMALVVATFLLWRSMNTQLGKIRVPPRASFGPNGDVGDRPADTGQGDGPPLRPGTGTTPPATDDEEER